MKRFLFLGLVLCSLGFACEQLAGDVGDAGADVTMSAASSAVERPRLAMLSPSDSGFLHQTNGQLDPQARAVQLGTSDVTGTLGVPHGGTGLTSVGTAGQVLATDGGVMYWLTPSAGPSVSGTGFAHVTSGSFDSPARAVNLASGDVTGTLAHGNGGTDVTSPSTAGKVLRSDGTNWTSNNIQSSDLLGLSPALASPSVTTALHGWIGDSGLDPYGQVGERIDIAATTVCVGDAGAVVCSGNLRSDVTFTDATTWTTFYTFTPPARHVGAVDIEFFAYDLVDAPDAGPVDFVRCTLQLTTSVSNGGNVTLVSQQAAAGLISPITLSPLGVAAVTGGVLSSITTFAFRAQTSAGQVQLQATGIAAKTYNLAGVQQHARGSGH